MALSKAAAKLIAEKLSESIDAGDISHNDLNRWLCDAVSDLAEPGQYSYLVDFIGDGESGDVIFSCGGDMKKAPYQITTVNGKVTCAIDDDQEVDVLPHTTYEEEADEADHYAGMEAAKLYQPGAAKFAERFISKTARDVADSSSFAGKGKSFPILKASDVMAAVRSIGRAGSDNHDAATLKSNIVRIAKSKGFASSLPKSWRGDAKESARMEQELAEAGARHSAADLDKIQAVHDHSIALGATCPTPSKESAKPAQEAATADARGVRLVESAQVSTDFEFREAAAISPMVKIISEGRGSSGFYTKEVLQRDGPEIFGRGTLMFVNHATEAEQKARPEGDWSKLAAVTEARAVWDDNGPAGPALYAPAAVFSKYAAEVKEKAPYTGVSINAYGQYAESATGLPNPKVKFHESKLAPDGKPGLIAKLTAADSIDLVTKAGRDGKLLLESATAPEHTTEGGADDMDAADFKKLQESNTALLAEVKKLQESNAEAITEGKKLRERRFIEEGTTEVVAYLKTVSVSEAVKDQVVRRLKERFTIPGGIPLTEAGAVDAAKVKTLAEAETNDELAFLRKVNPGLVNGMGTTPVKQLTEAERAERAKVQQRESDESQARFASLMGFGQIGAKGRKVLSEGRSAFDVSYNSRLNGKRADHGGTMTMEEE